jgi:hypothetical protein
VQASVRAGESFVDLADAELRATPHPGYDRHRTRPVSRLVASREFDHEAWQFDHGSSLHDRHSSVTFAAWCKALDRDHRTPPRNMEVSLRIPRARSFSIAAVAENESATA